VVPQQTILSLVEEQELHADDVAIVREIERNSHIFGAMQAVSNEPILDKSRVLSRRGIDNVRWAGEDLRAQVTVHTSYEEYITLKVDR
jgi:hypothetical protein